MNGSIVRRRSDTRTPVKARRPELKLDSGSWGQIPAVMFNEAYGLKGNSAGRVASVWWNGGLLRGEENRVPGPTTSVVDDRQFSRAKDNLRVYRRIFACIRPRPQYGYFWFEKGRY